MTTEEYIIQHLTDDVRDLALRTPPSGVDLHHALIQISGWQKSRAKLPLWASTPGIHYPQHLSMEQCSSQLTAEYKLSIIQRLCPSGGKMADLTAGFGVDATILGSHFSHLTLVEQNPELCQLLRHNLPLLGIHDFTVHCADSTTVPLGFAGGSPATVPSDSSEGTPAEGTTAPLYLYEPNASIMKAGIHDALIQAFPIKKIHPNSHLYLSHTPIPHFPGRQFRVLETIQPNKAGIRQLRQLRQANITVRNYPLTADQLRQRLQLRDGGSTYLFATTVTPDKHQIYVCEK